MQSASAKSPLDRFLTLFTEVRPGEGPTVVLLTFNVFLVLTSYYIAKVVREPLILAGGSAELKSYLSAGQILLLLGAVRAYAWLASRYPRKPLINVVNIFFSACMALFYLLAKMQMPTLGVIFFLWVGIFNVMVVAQFWSFANDIYTPEEGKRLFALVAFGASSGAVVGSYLPFKLIDVVGLYEMLLLACGILLLSLLITNFVDSRERNRHVARVASVARVTSEDGSATQPEDALGKEGAFKLVFQSRYLLMIAFLVMILNWVNTTGGYMLDRTVEEAAEAISSDRAAQEAFIGNFTASFFTIMNTTGLLIQLFLVSRVLKYFGIRVAVMILPIIALGGYFLYAIFPILAVVRAAKIAENATDYSLNNTVRHALFLPTTREQKYKGKQVVDSFFHRSGDVLSAALVFVGVTWLSFETRQFAFVNLGLVLVWLLLAIGVGRENSKMTEAGATGSADGADRTQGGA